MKKSMAELMGVIISADQEMSGEKGVLEILYDHYSEYHGFGSPLIEKFYKELREKTKELPFEEADQFLETVNSLRRYSPFQLADEKDCFIFSQSDVVLPYSTR